MHGLYPKRVIDTVLDAMTDHEKLSMEVLENPDVGRRFAMLLLKLLKQPDMPALGMMKSEVCIIIGIEK
ncbi:hypothetical protein P8S54_08145 [Thiomicrospira sp. R3]|uniref:hypothetical protein n=1 Tax=Thiomicrospira sp. R3 TaxID=3035472 RepID=UPI00259B7F20|nr:hypothetical protein [Thiomicrospira sp. R3]WFE68184.1 hypothetical protein P8S54_08145 [Thiomicrospira sp. R3]